MFGPEWDLAGCLNLIHILEVYRFGKNNYCLQHLVTNFARQKNLYHKTGCNDKKLGVPVERPDGRGEFKAVVLPWVVDGWLVPRYGHKETHVTFYQDSYHTYHVKGD